MSGEGAERPYSEFAPAEIWSKAFKDAGYQDEQPPENVMRMVTRGGAKRMNLWPDIQRRALVYALESIRLRKAEGAKISVREVASALGISHTTADALTRKHSSLFRAGDNRSLLQRIANVQYTNERERRFFDAVAELADEEGRVEELSLAKKLGVTRPTITTYWARFALRDKGYTLINAEGRPHLSKKLTQLGNIEVAPPSTADQIRELTRIRLQRAEEMARTLNEELGRAPTLEELAARVSSPERWPDMRIMALRILLGRNPEVAQRIFGEGWRAVLRG